MTHDTPAYGLWSLVVINTAVFLIFAFSFTRPRTARDWRSFGAFAAFLVALFTDLFSALGWDKAERDMKEEDNARTLTTTHHLQERNGVLVPIASPRKRERRNPFFYEEKCHD